jgi:hypothetical protein
MEERLMLTHVTRLGIIALGLSWLVGCGGGTDAAAQKGCSLETLDGKYIFAYDGFNVSGPTAADRVPFAAAGHETYNGDGTVSGATTTNTNGVVSAVAYSGTYTVASDCSGTTTLTDQNDVTTHYNIVIQQNGLVVGYVATDSNVVTAGYESRRSGAQGGCDAASLRGTYIYANDGFNTGGGASTQRSPFSQAGVEVYGGDGTMSGSVTVNSNGDVRQTGYDGSYSIDSSCAGEITSAGDGERPLHFAIYVDPSGDRFAFVRIDANVVNAGYDARQ